MVLYNFKAIKPVPTHTQFVDIVLNRTQRKTPTVVHPGYKISRIRSFYMRKVKFTQSTYHEKLSEVLDAFPKLDVCGGIGAGQSWLAGCIDEAGRQRCGPAGRSLCAPLTH